MERVAAPRDKVSSVSRCCSLASVTSAGGWFGAVLVDAGVLPACRGEEEPEYIFVS